MISYGLGPFFIKELACEIRSSIYFYTLCIDETSQIQKQMDLYVRYWSPFKMPEPIQCRYLTSIFLGHAEAETMFNALVKSVEIEGSPLSKIIMVSMDDLC